jgi:FkbM family methyltransferase
MITAEIAELRAEIDRRLAAYDRAEIKDWRLFEEPETRDITLDGQPLALLGAGAVMAQPFVSWAVSECWVAALVDNLRVGETRYGLGFASDEQFLDLARREPKLVAVMCCSGDAGVAHFSDLAARAGVRVLSLFQALRRAGMLMFGSAHGHPSAIETLAHDNPFLDRFADALSIKTYYCLLLHKLSWSRRWLDGIRLGYTDVLPITQDEILIDAGAYDGDSIRAFDRITRGQARHIYAFEPGPDNAATLRRNLQGRAEATVVEAGLWSETTRLSFRNDGLLSGVVGGEGVVIVPVVALDDSDIDEVSLLKMDIEGAEVPALRGGRALIARNAPKLAICAYHLADDLTEIPRIILDIRPEYRLFLRHHSPWLTDTVIYAV